MSYREIFLNYHSYGIERPDTTEIDNAIKTIQSRYYDTIQSYLIKSEESKIVIKENFSASQAYILRQKNVIANDENFLFRFQSLVSGRKSKAIPRKLMDKHGVTKKALETGGAFPDLLPFNNNLELVREYYNKWLYKLLDQRRVILSEYYESFRGQWWDIYNEYLQSNEWKAKRKDRLRIDDYTCQLCMCNDASVLQVHHETYQNVGDENMEDLLTVCHECHKALHGRDF